MEVFLLIIITNNNMPTPYARAKVVAVGGTAASLDLSGKATELILTATTDCWVNFNDTAVANNCFYLPTDQPVVVEIANKESISVIQDTAGGYLSALEQANVRLIDTVHEFFKGDASLVLNLPLTITADAALVTNVSATYSGDASLAAVVTGAATGDTNLLKTVGSSFGGNCYIDYA